MSIMETISNILGYKPGITIDVTFDTDNSIQLFKDKDGKYRKWVAVYSNSFRDDDLVPEILASDGHKKFVNEVDAGNYRLPELWIWHTPEWKLGTASVVAVDEVEPGIVFAIAGGYIDEGKEVYAKALAESPVVWRMSHTFYANKRNNIDDSFDDWYVEEVSVLPAGVEANPLTGFGFVEGSKMIDQKKREELEKVLGVDSRFLDNLEAQNLGVANMAKEEREFKAKTEETDVEEVTTETKVAEVEAVEEQEPQEEKAAGLQVDAEGILEVVDTDVETEEVVEDVVEPVPEEVTEEEPVQQTPPDVFMDAVSALTTAVKGLSTIVEAVQGEVSVINEKITGIDELKQEIEQMKEGEKTEVDVNTPLSGMLNYKSIIGDALAAQLDEDGELANAGPEEKEFNELDQHLGSFVGGLVKGSRQR